MRIGFCYALAIAKSGAQPRTIDLLKQFEPRHRKHWRGWLERQHAASAGVWLVYRTADLPALRQQREARRARHIAQVVALIAERTTLPRQGPRPAFRRQQ
jgi:hypothetical protein